MKIFKDLIAFFVEFYRSTREYDWFIPNEDWWLTKNVHKYAEVTDTEIKKDVCGFFWTAILWYPTLWLVGYRIRMHHSILVFLLTGIVTFGTVLLIALFTSLFTEINKSDAISCAILIAGVMGFVHGLGNLWDHRNTAKSMEKEPMIFTKAYYAYQKERFLNTGILSKLQMTVEIPLIHIVVILLGIPLLLVVIIPMAMYAVFKVNFCPVVMYE